ncbi:MAG: GNAT family protein [Bacteroidaceae bacterium]
MNEELLTDGVIRLRALEPEDLDFLYTIENDTACWNVSSVNVPYARYVLKQYIAEASQDIYTDCQLRLVAEDVWGNPVGLADLFDFNPRHNRAEVGIAVHYTQRGKGYSLRIIMLLERYACKILNIHQLYAYVSEKNEISRISFLKADYKEVGRLCDWVQYGGVFEAIRVFQKILQKTESKICRD